MRKLTLAVAVALFPACSGCAACAKALSFLFPSTDWEQEREIEYQNAKFQAYEDDRKWMEGKESNAWNPSTTP
jgi:hypothetical protein